MNKNGKVNEANQNAHFSFLFLSHAIIELADSYVELLFSQSPWRSAFAYEPRDSISWWRKKCLKITGTISEFFLFFEKKKTEISEFADDNAQLISQSVGSKKGKWDVECEKEKKFNKKRPIEGNKIILCAILINKSEAGKGFQHAVWWQQNWFNKIEKRKENTDRGHLSGKQLTK